jgi:hypothetical protein
VKGLPRFLLVAGSADMSFKTPDDEKNTDD